MSNSFFPSIPREINRCSRFLVRLLRSDAVNQVFGDFFIFHLRVALHHLDQALRFYDNQRIDSLES